MDRRNWWKDSAILTFKNGLKQGTQPWFLIWSIRLVSCTPSFCQGDQKYQDGTEVWFVGYTGDTSYSLQSPPWRVIRRRWIWDPVDELLWIPRVYKFRHTILFGEILASPWSHSQQPGCSSLCTCYSRSASPWTGPFSTRYWCSSIPLCTIWLVLTIMICTNRSWLEACVSVCRWNQPSGVPCGSCKELWWICTGSSQDIGVGESCRSSRSPGVLGNIRHQNYHSLNWSHSKWWSSLPLQKRKRHLHQLIVSFLKAKRKKVTSTISDPSKDHLNFSPTITFLSISSCK